MSDTQPLANLQQLLIKEIQSVKPPLSPADVAHIVGHVVKSLADFVPEADLKFYSELEELARYIRQAKLDISSIKPKDISTDHIPRATDELDAVVGATEEATNKIMDVCDAITVIAGSCSPEINQQLIDCTTKIFEACNFQDITGQRITKVVATLKHIDDKVEAIVKAMGDELHRMEKTDKTSHIHAADPEKGLLNGPQLPGNETTQDEIDRMMSEM